jgi:hypothetical protein
VDPRWRCWDCAGIASEDKIRLYQRTCRGEHCWWLTVVGQQRHRRRATAHRGTFALTIQVLTTTGFLEPLYRGSSRTNDGALALLADFWLYAAAPGLKS